MLKDRIRARRHDETKPHQCEKLTLVYTLRASSCPGGIREFLGSLLDVEILEYQLPFFEPFGAQSLGDLPISVLALGDQF